MASPEAAISVPPAAGPSDPTFRCYTAKQAASYVTGRPGYPDALIQTILTHHTATGGQLTTLLDVGCGPGRATRSFAPHFTRAFGVDPSVEMIKAAQAMPSPAATTPRPSEPIHFAVSTAEEIPGSELASILTPGSVDLLTVATAAHWFNMAPFWERAGAIVAPGGTVALWTGASFYCHPHKTPNAAAVQQVLFRLERERLAPYKTRGNKLSNGLYRELGMPWADGKHDSGFLEAEFVRKEWNVDGHVEVGGDFFMGQEAVSLERFAAGLATASMVTRWREANPHLAGTDEDVVNVAVRELREALGGQEWFEGGTATVLLLFKRR